MSAAQPDTSTERSWDARPGAARALRAVVLLAPISLGCLAAVVANQLIGMPDSTIAVIGRSLLIIIASTVVVWSVDRYARKLLPLAALMQLSLVFPDQAPSRFKSALKAGSSRRLERAVEETRRNGLALDPGDAARQVVQLIGAIGDHDRRTRGHSERVRLFADLVGEELKLSKEERQKLQWGALLHDLGKLMVPADILNKKGKPTDEEWRILQGHPAAGMELIAPLREFLGEWVYAIGGHHEKWDGTGYPAGLRGSQIPRAAAIVAVADSFEVMTAVRSYKKAMPLPDARAELTRCAGTHFAPEVVRAFLSISLGHLRIVAGPLAALAHLPFLGNLAQIPAAAAAAPALVNAAAIPMAAVVTAAALTVGTAPAKADAMETIASEQSAAATGGSAPSGAASATDGGSGATSSGRAAGDDSAPADGQGGAPGGVGRGAGGSSANVESEHTSTGADAGSSDAGPGSAGSDDAGSTTTTSVASIGGAPTVAGAPTATTTTVRRATTTAAPATMPATTAPPATVAPTTAAPATTAPAAAAFDIKVAGNNLHLLPASLNGASFSRGSQIYVYVPITAEEIKFTYPGGNSTRQSNPFDMMGTTLVLANPYTVPSTPGTYSLTAVAKFSSSGPGSGTQATVTMTFTVT